MTHAPRSAISNGCSTAFKLRGDLQRRWSRDGGALAGYRVQAGALLLAGDPVGTDEANAALLLDAIEHARRIRGASSANSRAVSTTDASVFGLTVVAGSYGRPQLKRSAARVRTRGGVAASAALTPASYC